MKSGRARTTLVLAGRAGYAAVVLAAVPAAGMLFGRRGARWIVRRLSGTGGAR